VRAPAELHDADGVPVTDEARVVAEPARDVLARERRPGTRRHPPRGVAELGLLVPRSARAAWFVWTLPWLMRYDGTYLATMESGDPAAYTLDPTCADWTLVDRQPRRPGKGRGHHGH
jgi:hypothetical protein